MIPKSGHRFSEKIMRKQIFLLISPFCSAAPAFSSEVDAGSRAENASK